jgi:hypothetical protein
LLEQTMTTQPVTYQRIAARKAYWGGGARETLNKLPTSLS